MKLARELFPIIYQIALEHDFLCIFCSQKIRFMQALHAEIMMYGVRQPTLGLTKVAASSQHLFCRTPLSSSSPVTAWLNLPFTPKRFPVWRRDITKPFTASSVVTSSAQRNRGVHQGNETTEQCEEQRVQPEQPPRLTH